MGSQLHCDEDIVYSRSESTRRCIPQHGVASVKLFSNNNTKLMVIKMTYLDFINNIIETRGRFSCGDKYHEKHHIIPKCMNGTDNEENLIDLYAREHYGAHRLLALENPDNEKILFAWGIMSTKSSNTDGRYELTAEEYEEAKMALSEAQS